MTMDCEKKIEIPFGAFDSELIRQEINIPKGFKATIEGDKIILTRTEREDEKVRKALAEMVHDTTGDELWVDYNVHKEEALAWLEKQGEQKHADTVEPKCEESKTKIFDAPTPFEDKLFAFVAACEFLTLSVKIEFIKNHSQELLDAAKKQIEKEEIKWSEEDEVRINRIVACLENLKVADNDILLKDVDWLKSLRPQNRWKPSELQLECLSDAIEHYHKSGSPATILGEMLEQLKKHYL